MRNIMTRGGKVIAAFFGVILVIGLSSAVACADELPAIPVIPAQTKILILPTLDETGDRPDMQKAHVDFGNHRLEYEFISRGFQVLGPDMAIRAARGNDDLDLTDEDSRTKGSMHQLATMTGATWVVSVAVIEVNEEKSRLGNRRAGAKIKLRIFDATQDGWIADRFFEDHKDSFGSYVGTTGLFRAAIDTTVQRSTSNLLDQYPKIITVGDEFGQEDYLPGQTQAFIGDPKTPFNGLNPATTASDAPVPGTTPDSATPAAAASTDGQPSTTPPAPSPAVGQSTPAGGQ